MARPPSHLDAALTQLAASLAQVQGKPVDLLTAPWAEVESGIIKLLRGPYVPERPEHQLVALGLAAAFGQRLAASDNAFWFPMREAPEGAMLGFPEAVLMLSPFTSVSDALARAQLAKLDDAIADWEARAVGGRRRRVSNAHPRRLYAKRKALLSQPLKTEARKETRWTAELLTDRWLSLETDHERGALLRSLGIRIMARKAGPDQTRIRLQQGDKHWPDIVREWTDEDVRALDEEPDRA